MKLKTDWPVVLRRAWSLRLTAVSVALSGAEVVVNVLSSNPPLPVGTFAALAGAVSIAAAVARLVVQSGVTPESAS